MSHERQKPVNDNYRDNYDRIFGPEDAKPPVRKGKQGRPTQPHRDKTKYDRTTDDDLSRKSGGW